MAAVFFSKFFATVSGVPALSLFSYTVVIPFYVGLLGFLSKGKLTKLFITIWLTIAVLSVLSAAGPYSMGIRTSVLAVLIYIKIFYLIYAFRNANITDLEKPLAALTVIHLAGMLASFLSPEIFLQFKPQAFDNRWERLSGFQMNANYSAFLSAVLALYYTFTKKKPALALLLVTTIILTDSRTGFLMFVIPALYLSLVRGQRSLALNVVAISIVSMAAYNLGAERLLGTVQVAQNAFAGYGQYPRVAMLLGGFQLAFDNFPVSAGGGAFASSLSLNPGAYWAAGVGYMLHEDLVSGIFDSGIGEILGQFGFLGLLLIIAALYICLKQIGRNILLRTDLLFIIALILMTSLSLTVISDFYTGLCILLIVIITRDIRRQKAARQMASNLRALSCNW